MEKTKFKPYQLKKYILAGLGISLILGGSLFFTPNFPIILGTILKIIEKIKGIKIPSQKAKRVLKQLEKEQLIEIERRNNEIYVKVKKGDSLSILKYSLKELLALKNKKKWEGKWFLVVFDVPENQRNKRDYLRSFLKEIGFYPYNQSVYVFPYECKKEISLLKKIVQGGEYISYIVAEKIEKEKELKAFFKIERKKR